MKSAPTLDGILQLGMGFWGSKALLSAVELSLFTELAKGSLTADELRGRLKLPIKGLHGRPYIEDLLTPVAAPPSMPAVGTER